MLLFHDGLPKPKLSVRKGDFILTHTSTEQLVKFQLQNLFLSPVRVRKDPICVCISGRKQFFFTSKLSSFDDL